MKAPKFGLAAAVAAALVLTACSGGQDSDSDGGDGGSSDNADIKIGMVTHGDAGAFWSVAKKGAVKAGSDLGVQLDYSESNNDPKKQADLIEAGVEGASRPGGLGAEPRRPQGAAGQGRRRGDPDRHAELRLGRLPAARRLHPRRPDREHRRPAAGPKLKERAQEDPGDHPRAATSASSSASRRQGEFGNVVHLQVAGLNDLDDDEAQIQTKLGPTTPSTPSWR